MPQINCYIPIKLRITGQLSDAQLDELSDRLVRALVARIALAERTIWSIRAREGVSEQIEFLRQEYDPNRDDRSADHYSLPSYDHQGALEKVKVFHRRGVPKGLDLALVARASTRLPTANVKWLIDLTRDAVRWVKRLTVDLAQVIPEVDVTIELFRLRDPSIWQEIGSLFQEYLEKRNANTPFWIGDWGNLARKPVYESNFHISLDKLFSLSGVHLPTHRTTSKSPNYSLLSYVSFPSSIEQYLVPESVLEAAEAVEAAQQQEPIGKFDEILKNPDQFRDKLEGPDDKLVVVMRANDERQVTTLKVLREYIAQVREARQNPWLTGYFERSISEHDKREFERMLNLQQGFLDTRSIYFQLIQVTSQGGGKVTVNFQSQWLFPDRLDFKINYNPRIASVPEETIVALQIGGPTVGQAAAGSQVVELLVTMGELPSILERVQSTWRRQVMIREAFRQVEFLSEAVTIQLAIGTAGRLASAGQTGLATLRQAGLRAAATQVGRALLTRAGLALAGEALLNLLLPTVTFYAHANREDLKKTASGRAFTTAVDWANYLVAAYGFGRLALGGFRILKARIGGLPPTNETQGLLFEVNDLIAKAEQATLRESESLIIAAASEENAARQILAGKDGAAVLVAAERESKLLRYAILAETKQGLDRYTQALAARLRAAGLPEEQIAAAQRAIEALNSTRRAAALAALTPELQQQEALRVAQLARGAELRQEARTMLEELARRRRTFLEAGKARAAGAISRRMGRLSNWMRSRSFLEVETAALSQAVATSPFLSAVAAKGGGPMLRRLWLMFRAPRQRALKATFEEYVSILQSHFRGNFGEFEVAFRLSERFIVLKPPDNLVTAPGTDLIVIQRGGGDILQIDNKALNASQVNEADALTRHLPKNNQMDLNSFAQLAGQAGLPAEFSQAMTRLQKAHNQIQPIIQGLTNKQFAALPIQQQIAIQQQIDRILQQNGIRRVVTNAGGNVQGLSAELQDMGIRLRNLN